MPEPDEDERREEAFLALIRFAEHGGQERPDSYNILHGNGHIGDLSKHLAKPATKWGHTSTAAGAYGITQGTYNFAVSAGAAHNFYPASQDAIARFLINRAGALRYIWEGQLDAAFSSLNHTWASWPGGSQQEVNSKEAKHYFWSRLGEAVR